MSYEDFDLDAILADFLAGADAAQPPADEPESPSEPAAGEPSEEQAYVEPDWQSSAGEEPPAEEPDKKEE